MSFYDLLLRRLERAEAKRDAAGRAIMLDDDELNAMPDHTLRRHARHIMEATAEIQTVRDQLGLLRERAR